MWGNYYVGQVGQGNNANGNEAEANANRGEDQNANANEGQHGDGGDQRNGADGNDEDENAMLTPTGRWIIIVVGIMVVCSIGGVLFGNLFKPSEDTSSVNKTRQDSFGVNNPIGIVPFELKSEKSNICKISKIQRGQEYYARLRLENQNFTVVSSELFYGKELIDVKVGSTFQTEVDTKLGSYKYIIILTKKKINKFTAKLCTKNFDCTIPVSECLIKTPTTW